ncbi:MAG: formylglycine-generating enzyme family protein, partial [Alphaproteobacteria bacterium]
MMVGIWHLVMAGAVVLGVVVGNPPSARAGSDGTGPAPGATFRDCPDCPDMVVVPAGRFIMGSMDGDDDEKPPHQVTLARPVAIGRTEVTVGQWAAFVKATSHPVENSCYFWSVSQWVAGEGRTWLKPGFDQSEQDPVVCVSWDDAHAFVTWLNTKVSQGGGRGGGP